MADAVHNAGYGQIVAIGKFSATVSSAVLAQRIECPRCTAASVIMLTGQNAVADTAHALGWAVTPAAGYFTVSVNTGTYTAASIGYVVYSAVETP